MSKVPVQLRASLAALAVALGASGVYFGGKAVEGHANNQAYVEAVAMADASLPVKLAMVMGNWFESSNRHIGKPYVDHLGRGRPITVCNGITNAVAPIDPRRYYSQADCVQLELMVYRGTERQAMTMTTTWSQLTPFQAASILDHIHQFGPAAYATSTMRRKFNAGDLEGGCQENPRWRKSNGKVVQGIVNRKLADEELCMDWTIEGAQ